MAWIYHLGVGFGSPTPPNQLYEVKTMKIEINEEAERILRSFCRENNCSLKTGMEYWIADYFTRLIEEHGSKRQVRGDVK